MHLFQNLRKVGISLIEQQYSLLNLSLKKYTEKEIGSICHKMTIYSCGGNGFEQTKPILSFTKYDLETSDYRMDAQSESDMTGV